MLKIIPNQTLVISMILQILCKSSQPDKSLPNVLQMSIIKINVQFYIQDRKYLLFAMQSIPQK